MIKQIFPIIAAILLLTFIYVLNQSEGYKTNGRQCYLEEDVCALTMGDLDFSIEFVSGAPEIEEELSILFRHSDKVSLRNAWIEGTNMFMGKTRVILSAPFKEEGWEETDAVTFLGACSEPHMRWRLTAEYEVLESGQTETLYFNFQTEIGK